ncbi:MAG: tRNA (adenosine(37)-N6)-threonylcarbamoyltransferase complex dimerization subunit type 1 TsaB [Burkholderiales bacterium]
MNILALDTSTEYCSVALWLDGSTDARDAAAGQAHSQMVLPMVDELLGQHRLALRDLDGIAFGRGPGSFTGLRIACGVTQGLALGAGLPVVGVSTLLALAEAVRSDHAVCCLDARMGEIYHASYVRSGEEWRAVHEVSLCAPAAAPPLPPGAWTGCGSGFEAHGETLRKRYGERLAAVRPELYPHAREIARLGAREFERGKGMPAEQALPLYVRDKVALRSDERPA